MRILARIGPGGGGEGPIRTKILIKYVDFGLAEIADPPPPGGEENKILAKKTKYYTRKQNIKWVNKIFRIFCLPG